MLLSFVKGLLSQGRLLLTLFFHPKLIFVSCFCLASSLGSCCFRGTSPCAFPS